MDRSSRLRVPQHPKQLGPLAHALLESQQNSLPEPGDFVGSLADQYELDSDQEEDLHMMVNYGRNLDRADLLLRLSSHAAVCDAQNATKAILHELETLAEMVVDLKRDKIQKQSWRATQIQVDTIHMCTKDHLVNPHLESYTDLPVIVLRKLESEAKSYHLKEAFRNAEATKEVERIVQDCSRKFLNQMRALILESVKSSTKTYYKDVAATLWWTFKSNKIERVPKAFAERVAVMRRFVNEILKRDFESDYLGEDQFWKHFDGFTEDLNKHFCNSKLWREFVEDTLEKERKIFLIMQESGYWDKLGEFEGVSS